MNDADFGFVTNATEGINAVLRSLALQPGDELLTTNHVYHAVRQAMRLMARRAGATMRELEVPFPVQSAEQIQRTVINALSARTRLLVIDHITSPTALVFPMERIIAGCAAAGVDVLVDGAHAPGMVRLDVAKLGATYYAGNLHKWACAPKGSAFLWVTPDRKKEVHPTIVSHYLDE
jgi:isopenicillin-N epimerase